MFKLRFRSWLNEGPEIHKLAEGVEKHIFDDKKIKDLQAEFNLLMKNASKISDPNQLELDFEKRVRYEDIEGKLQILENKLIALNEKADNILELLRKKKLNEQQDGTQTG